ncbi:hypothetical protein TCAL_13172 [Tigriopus californicus]|uniref:Senescence domain-containing protein n=1 Tax=Tigriopus californicus TaxID=6832 RepID=A0A553NV02_TIGCA|nr:uncharacterized protein LOC131879287 [Tigriopus californicus]TRY69250.1 hypothetical protein TCAL_13172 [Tigriopus californicus]|eukprot:TCALIF_13172-PA protein Name:"Similar to Spg20 Spartin (Mus musculus)" AED:0.08 eAED:0.08 QI:0/-1/0/1/-1/1/1/0/332
MSMSDLDRVLSRKPYFQPRLAIRLDHGVQLFAVDKNGIVSTFAYSSSLVIWKMNEDTAIIQVLDWFYFLRQGESPVLKAQNGAYMFPISHVQTIPGTVGIVLIDEVDNDTRFLFHGILSMFADVIVQRGAKSGTKAEIHVGLHPFGKWLKDRGEAVALLIEDTTIQTCSRIETRANMSVAKSPACDPDKKLNGFLVYTARGIKGATGTTEKITGKAAHGLESASDGIGAVLAKQLTRPMNVGTRQAQLLENTMDITFGGVWAYDSVKDTLEVSAVHLGRCIRDQTVRVITHKHGVAAGVAAGQVVGSVGDLLLTAHHVHEIGEFLSVEEAAF